jgi:hypothetical protein
MGRGAEKRVGAEKNRNPAAGTELEKYDFFC